MDWSNISLKIYTERKLFLFGFVREIRILCPKNTSYISVFEIIILKKKKTYLKHVILSEHKVNYKDRNKEVIIRTKI